MTILWYIFVTIWNQTFEFSAWTPWIHGGLVLSYQILTVVICSMDIVHMRYLHDRVRAHRAHGKEMEDCKKDQHCLLKWSLLKWKKRVNKYNNKYWQRVNSPECLDPRWSWPRGRQCWRCWGEPKRRRTRHSRQSRSCKEKRNYEQALGYVNFSVLQKNKNIVNNVKMWDQTC